MHPARPLPEHVLPVHAVREPGLARGDGAVEDGRGSFVYAQDSDDPAEEWRLTDQERIERHSTLAAEGASRQANFLADFLAREEDPRSLPRVNIMASFGPLPAQDLDELIKYADLVVVASVEDLAFRSTSAGPMGTLHLQVELALKGDVSDSVMLEQAGGPVMVEAAAGSNEHDHFYFSHLREDPALLEGDRAVLFLKEAELGYHATIPFLGKFLVVDGRLASLYDGNPLNETLDGLPLAEFAALVDASRQSATP